MSTLIAFIAIGLIFVSLVIAFRYYNHKMMTERVCSKNPDSEYCRRYYQNKLDKSEDEYEQCEVVYGKTPQGGVKTAICYVDDSNRIVKKRQASKVLIRELDEKNKPVYETWTSLEEAEAKKV